MQEWGWKGGGSESGRGGAMGDSNRCYVEWDVYAGQQHTYQA